MITWSNDSAPSGGSSAARGSRNTINLFLRAGLLIAFLPWTELRGQSGPLLTLTSTLDSSVPEVTGPPAWADEGRCLASTFKVFLSWVALEEGMAVPDTRLDCADPFIPGTPRALSLHQAMFYSSNTYFLKLFAGRGPEKVEGYLVRSGLFGEGEKIPQNWLGDSGSLIRGGSLLISPARNHEFMRRVAFGKLASTAKVQQDLEAVLRWPGPKTPEGGPVAPIFYGKTGTYGGAVWFNGFAEDAQGVRRVRTVFLPGTVSRRTEAINAFYQGWKLAWDPAWQSWLER